MPPTSRLFPDLAKKKTQFMVKADLAAAGIPYETAEGKADFHAAGRHTHITELLRNGASLPQAMELARHSDVTMTMRYAHIGIDDQAAALANLPAPTIPPSVAQNSALQMRCISDGVSRHSASPAVASGAQKNAGSACDEATSDVVRHGLSDHVIMEDRGLEPLTSCMPCKRSPS